MENLNNIPSTGTFGNSINKVNQNFGLVKDAIENVEGRTIRSKGLFPTAAALSAAYPSPKVGDYAYVGSSLPATIYDCVVEGEWNNTGQTGGSESVPLNDYPTKSEMNAAIEAIEIETVDNLNEQTTGKALDAHQGFVLAGQIAESTKYVPVDINKFYQGGIAGATGADTTTPSRIRSEYIPVKTGNKLVVTPNGHQTSVYLYNTDKTSALGQYAVNLNAESYEYTIPQSGYIRVVEAKADTSQAITPSECVALFMLYATTEYATKKDISPKVNYDDIATEIDFTDLPVLRGYPLAGGTWNVPTSGSNFPYHAIIERKEEMKKFKLVSSSSLKCRYAFVTDYAIPATGDACNFCNGEPVVTIDENKDSGWVDIPSDCKYIILIRQNAGVSYIPSNIYVVKDDTDYNVDGKLLLTSGDFVNGNFDANGQIPSGSTTQRIRTNAYFKVNKGDEVVISFQAFRIQIWKYDETKTFIESTSWFFKRKFKSTFDGYLRFTASTLNGSTDISPSTFTGKIYVPQSSGESSDGGDDYASRVPTVARPPRKGNTVQGKMLTLLWFSDIHITGKTELQYILNFQKKYNAYIDDVLSTGDLQDRGFESDIAAFRELADDGAKNILQVIGNHDYYNSGANVWTYNTNINVYNRFFAPFIANWGVTQPANAATNGYNYWYKDYADATYNRPIRLIALDTNNNGSNVDKWDATQKTWLEGVLADAKSNGLHVVVASHYKPRMTYIDCNMSDKTLQLSNAEDYMNNEAVTTVQDFIDGGGKFICWLCGHEHNDYIGTTSVTGTNQLVVGISLAQSGVRTNYSVMDRIADTKSANLFNIIGFDTYNKHIRILRIGADFDIFMRSKKSLCINYETHDIISQS